MSANLVSSITRENDKFLKLSIDLYAEAIQTHYHFICTMFSENRQKTDYHSANHDDFGTDVSRHKEDIHEAQTEEGKCDGVHHPGPDKILSVRRVAHNDRDRQQTVHYCVKLVPGTLKVAVHFMLQGERMCRDHLKDVIDRIKHF